MPFDQAHKQYETARHLPPPLYVLFVQASAYGQACGEHRGGSAVLGHTARGCHQLGLGGNAPPTGQISFKTLLWGHFGRSFSSHLLCCRILLSPEQRGGLRASAMRQQHLKPCLLSSLAGRTTWEARFLPLPPPFSRLAGTSLQPASWLGADTASRELSPSGVGAMLCHPWVLVTPEQAVPLPALAEALSRSSPESLHPLRQLWISRGFLKPP